MVETEQTVIGCLILDYPRCREAAAEILPEWFETREYADIMARIKALEEEGIPPDSMTVIAGLDEQAKAEVLRCAQLVPSIANFPRYARELKEQWRKRTVTAKLQSVVWDPKTPVGEMTETLRGIVAEQDEIAEGDRREVGRKFTDAAADFYEGLFGEAPRILSGYARFDGILGGLLPGSVCVIAARPGQGKTDFCLSLMMRYAAKQKVIYYSMEMSDDQLLTRIAAQMTRISNTRIRDRALSKQELASISHALGTVKGNENIRFADTAPTAAKLREDVRAFRPGVIFLDHLGLMKMPALKDIRQAYVETTKEVKALARESGIAVVELVQMSREIEKRTSKRPMLSDLKESSSIEADADYVVFLKADKGNRPLTGGDAYHTAAYIEKNRHGGTGVAHFAWRPQYSTFTEAVSSIEPAKGGEKDE